LTKQEVKNVIMDLKKYYNETPPIELVAEALSLPVNETKIIMKSLEKEIKKKKKKLYNFDISTISIIIIKMMMGIIGIGASIMSCYYTSVWLFEFLPRFLSVFLSLLMIMFSVLSFQLIILFWEDNRITLISIFIILWIIVAVFSMGSTIAGQYNKRMILEKESIEKEKSYKSDLLVIEVLKKEEETLLKQIEEKNKVKDSTLSLLEEYKDIEIQRQNRPYYNDLQWRMTRVNRDLNNLSEQLTKVREEMKKRIIESPEMFIEEEKKEIKDFYFWLANILKTSKDIIQFWLSIFPALFIDIIAPVGLAVCFFLKREK